MLPLLFRTEDSAEIESAIQTGEQVETDKEIITPIDSKTAVIQDKENGEFTNVSSEEELCCLFSFCGIYKMKGRKYRKQGNSVLP